MSVTNPAPRAAIYCRISRDAEGEGVGVARQEDECRRLAQRNGHDVVEVFTDNDLGASERTHKGKVRHEFARMVERVKAGDFDVIVAYSNSRLTRRMSELEDLIRLHETTGVEFVTVVSGQDDLSKADGRMVARIKASVDVAESDRISERAKAAHRQKAMSGKVKRQQQRPFGWREDQVTADPVEAEIIRAGVRDLARGMSIETIRAGWMEQGIRTATGGTDWSWATTNRVLMGWRTVGVRTYLKEPVRDADGELVMGEWEPIITFGERDAALAQVNQRRLVKRRHGVYLLSSLVRCGECGGTMYGAVGQASRPTVYACKPGRGHVVISAAQFEQYVATEMLTRMVSRVRREGVQEVELEVRVWPKEQRLVEVGERIAEIMDAWRAGRMPDEVVFPQVDLLHAEQRELRNAREAFLAVETPVEPLTFATTKEVVDFAGDFFELPLAEMQAALRAEVRAVVVNRGVRGSGAKGWRAMTDRVSIVWMRP